MSSNYQFDKVYLKSLLDRCYETLQSKKLSASKRSSIESDVLFLEGALKGSYEINDGLEEDKSDKTFPELQAELTLFLKVLYRNLGEEGLKFIIKLHDLRTFDTYFNYSSIIVPEDIIVKNTLKTYEGSLPFLLAKAQKVLSLEPAPHVFITDDPTIDSFCHRCEIVDESFAIVNLTDGSSSLGHEVEHGVEDRFNFVSEIEEAGPILMEMLFSDTLFRSEGISDYSIMADRIEDNGYYLDFLSEFAKFTLALAKKRFSVSSYDFKKMFNENIDVQDGDVEAYLREDTPIKDVRCYLEYLFSFLSAIDFYYKISGSNFNMEKAFMSFIKTKSWPIPKDKDIFHTYENYVEEISRKM